METKRCRGHNGILDLVSIIVSCLCSKDKEVTFGLIHLQAFGDLKKKKKKQQKKQINWIYEAGNQFGIRT